MSNILKYSFIVVFAFVAVSPFVFAGTETGGAGINIKTNINNPLGQGRLETIPEFINEIIKIVLTVGVPIVALAIIYTGFLFVKAQGNPDELVKAKKAFVFTIVGAAILLGAFVIANAIDKTVDDIKSST